MANENSRDPTTPKPQSIPLAKIHDLPGIPLVSASGPVSL